MQRDIDLIRQILIEVERKKSPMGLLDIEVDNFSKEQISYHVKLLAEAGYLDAKDLITKDGFEWKPVGLTWLGHEFLDAARDNTVWNKAKKSIGSKLASTSIEVIKALLISLCKQGLGIEDHS
ncbi:MAG: DUF2513 domain-containing protein [Flavobacteriales bacterium]|nr:DUF2513 domain-containing protein [Flavobacteriales bacterium]